MFPFYRDDVGYGPAREQLPRNSRGWSEGINPLLPVTGTMLQLSTPVRVVDHEAHGPGILQLQFVGEDAPPFAPALDVQILQGVDTGLVQSTVYVGRVGVAVPCSAGKILADVVRTRGLPGRIVAQFRPGIASDMGLSYWELVPGGTTVTIPVPLGTSRWTVELAAGVSISVNVGKGLTVVGPGPVVVSGIMPNDGTFQLTATPGPPVGVLLRFEGNA